MPPSVDKDNDVKATWLTVEFLQDLLRGENDTSDVFVTGRDVEMAVAKGDNYMSTIYRVRVQFKEAGSEQVQTSHLIIKVQPEGEYLQKIMDEMGLFRRELAVYSNMLPEFNRLQKTLAPLSARYFFTSRPDTLVLEDLRPQGFVMSDRQNRLDLPHCRLVVRSLARLHGLSAVLIHRDPKLLDDFANTMYTKENRQNINDFVQPQMKALAGIAESWQGYERFGQKLRNLLPHATDRLIEASLTPEGSFKVLVHGDCWINNILFKYSPAQEAVDIRFVDFQVSRISSPALDLQYFLCPCPQDEVREQSLDQLLQDYHETLCDTVKGLDPDVKVLSLEQLHEEMRKAMMFGFISAMTILAAVVGDPDDSPELSQLKTEEVGEVNAFEKTQRSPQFRQAFQKLLVSFEKGGLFE